MYLVPKLLQKSSVSKFVSSIVRCFLSPKFRHFYYVNIADVIFEVGIQYLR
jgi:hypothetical protein